MVKTCHTRRSLRPLGVAAIAIFTFAAAGCATDPGRVAVDASPSMEPAAGVSQGSPVEAAETAERSDRGRRVLERHADIRREVLRRRSLLRRL